MTVGVTGHVARACAGASADRVPQVHVGRVLERVDTVAERALGGGADECHNGDGGDKHERLHCGV